MRHINIGTAGHIDHGKTALVKALTGIDTDSLKEEKERGITIDIGFAHWNDYITMIDVPGHERFIRNMIAGVHAIDFALLVIAANEGIKPQTIEHLRILDLLQIPSGAVVLTKTDLAEESRLHNLETDIRQLTQDTFLKDAPVFFTSAVNGSGLQALSAYLTELPGKYPAYPTGRIFRLPVDRVFKKAGFGTVVTGTVISGSAELNATVEIFPSRQKVRVRGIQKHGRAAASARFGDRAAINVSGDIKIPLTRGVMIADADTLNTSRSYYVHVKILQESVKPITASSGLRILIGTEELFGKIKPLNRMPIPSGETALALMQINGDRCYIRGDRFIIREKNARSTIGGGTILWNAETAINGAPVHETFLSLLYGNLPEEAVKNVLRETDWISMNELPSLFGLTREFLNTIVAEAVRDRIAIHLPEKFDWIINKKFFDELKNQVHLFIADWHRQHPQEHGIKKNTLKKTYAHLPDALYDYLLEILTKDGTIDEQGEIIRLSGFTARMDEAAQAIISRIAEMLDTGGFAPPSVEEIAQRLDIDIQTLQGYLRKMIAMKLAVSTDSKTFFHSKKIEKALQLLVDFVTRNGHITIQDFKALTNTSRKYALSLLEYFDRQEITIRRNDKRYLNP